MSKFLSLLLSILMLVSIAASTAEAGSTVLGPEKTEALPEATAALPPAFKASWRKPTLHRPNYTYYKGDKKKRGILSFLSFGKK